jgi:hypothetical protein
MHLLPQLRLNPSQITSRVQSIPYHFIGTATPESSKGPFEPKEAYQQYIVAEQFSVHPNQGEMIEPVGRITNDILWSMKKRERHERNLHE